MAAELLRSAVLGLVQGLTEFLPVSSSAHLILFSKFLQWPDQGLAFDIAANTGTLVALLVYFRSDLLGLLRRTSISKVYGWPLLPWLMVGTVPVGVFGLVASQWIAFEARDARLIGFAMVGFGLLLWIADWLVDRPGFGERRSDAPLGLRDALVLGLGQAMALIPGTSRSGAVMTAGLFSGFDRERAARLAFLMAIPVGFLVAGKQAMELLGAAEPVAWLPLMVGFVAAAASGYLVIALLLEWLKTRGMLPFVLYRIALGMVLLVVFR